MKHRAHPFELAGDAARLLFITVGEHNEVLAAHFKPVLRGVPGGARQSFSKNQQERERAAHMGARVMDLLAWGQLNPTVTESVVYPSVLGIA